MNEEELRKAEHEARCDLIDALFYIEIMWGGFGDYITTAEKARANQFWREMKTKYPQQKAIFGNPLNDAQIEERDYSQLRVIEPPQ